MTQQWTEAPLVGCEDDPTAYLVAVAGAVRQSIPRKVRFAMLRRDGFQCRYCGRRPPEVPLEPDHILPVAAGGTNDLANLITACRDCNRGKGDYAETDDGQEVRVPRGRDVWRLRRSEAVEYKHTAEMDAVDWYQVVLDLERQRVLLDRRIRTALQLARRQNAGGG